MNDEVVRKGIAEYKWYQPVEFGNGLIADSYLGPHASHSYEFGLKKWRYIIDRNLPDIQGMRVLDIGCNCGLYCIQLARMGAREVIGVDWAAGWPSWQEQALFVKDALEWRCHTRYNIQYVESSMTKIPELNLGRFDVVIALCCIYYIKDDEMHALLSSFARTGCSKIVLQGNTNRKDQSAEVYHRALPNRALPNHLSHALRRAGYPYVYVDAPLSYSRPVVVGSLEPIRSPRRAKRDRLRDWVRRIF